MYRDLMVPLDGNIPAEYSVPVAARIAFALGAKVHLVHVVEPNLPVHLTGFVSADSVEAQTGRAHMYLESRAKQLRDVGIDVSISVLNGQVAASLLAYVADHGIDLVVMTTHGRPPIRKLWTGSVADRLVSSGLCPVLLRTYGASSRIAWTHHEHFRRILVTLDGSELAECALEHANVLARIERAHVTLLHIADPVLSAVGAHEMFSATVTNCVTDPGEPGPAAAAYLESTAGRLRDTFEPATDVVYRTGPAANAILEQVRTQDADLVIMTTHGASGVTGRVLGGTTDKVVRTSAVPVLVIPARPADPSLRQQFQRRS